MQDPQTILSFPIDMVGSMLGGSVGEDDLMNFYFLLSRKKAEFYKEDIDLPTLWQGYHGKHAREVLF